MSLFFTVAGTTDITPGVRFPDADHQPWSLIEAAEKGTVGTGGFDLDDPASAANLPGLKSILVRETACSVQTLYAGYIADRDLERGVALRTGADRQWGIRTTDLNAGFSDLIIQSGKRPSETDIARIAWLLGSGYLAMHDHGLIDSSSPVTLPASDYTGRYPIDVLNDCSNLSNCNFYATRDDATGDTTLAYHTDGSPTNTSTLRISNVLTDLNSTTLYPDFAAKMMRDPSRVYSGVFYEYSGSRHVYVTLGSTGTTFRPRDVRVSDATVTSASAATALANRYLNSVANEEDRMLTCTLTNVPSASVNLIRAGQRVSCRFSHISGYTSFTYLRVTRRTVRALAQDVYEMDLELSNPILTGFAGSLTPPIITPSSSLPPATTNTNVDGGCAVVVGGGIRFGFVGDAELAKWGTGAQLSDSGGLGTNGCDIAATRWYGGPTSGALYYPIAITCKGTGALVLRWTQTNTLEDRLSQGPVDDFGYYAYLWPTVPTALDGGILMGSFHTGAITLDIPAYLLPASGTVYLMFSPISRVFQGPICITNFGTPIKDQRGLAYGYDDGIAAVHWMALDTGQTAMADWLPVEEAPTGQLVTFTLAGWDGTGTPQVLVNGLAATVVSVDTTALTVTLAAPPPANSLVLARYPVTT